MTIIAVHYFGLFSIGIRQVIHCSAYGSAAGMAHDHGQFGAQMVSVVFNACCDVDVHHIVRCTSYKQIPQPLIKNKFG